MVDWRMSKAKNPGSPGFVDSVGIPNLLSPAKIQPKFSHIQPTQFSEIVLLSYKAESALVGLFSTHSSQSVTGNSKNPGRFHSIT